MTRTRRSSTTTGTQPLSSQPSIPNKTIAGKRHTDSLAHECCVVNGCAGLNPAAYREVVEALKAIQQGFQDGSITWAKPRQADTDPYHPANTLMCNALTFAEQTP